jgi:hypothetical protein
MQTPNMKRSFICCFFLLFFTTTFAQTKQELNFEVTNLKEQVKTLEASNQVLIVKTASLEKDVEYLQKQIDELKLLVNSQAQRMPTQEFSNSTAPSLPQATPAPAPRPQPTPTSTVGQYGRCRATTQKGTQCSRNAKSNGYCYQHGGSK